MQSIVATIKRAFWAIFLGLALISFPLPSVAVTVQDIPNPQQVDGGWVTDMANLLDPETKATLNQIISKLEAENGVEIAVVTVPDTAPADTPKQFATQLFNYWRIGKTNTNNGVIFLISRDERRVEIDTSYGIEKILPSAQLSNIIDQLIIPHFKQGDFAGGTMAGIQALTKALARHDILATTSSLSSKRLPDTQAYMVFFVIIGLIVAAIAWGVVGIIEGVNGTLDEKHQQRRRRSDNWGDNSDSWEDSSGDGGSSFGGGDSDGGSW